LAHQPQVLVEDGVKENAGLGVGGAAVLLAVLVLIVEDFLDFEPTGLNLDVTEH